MHKIKADIIIKNGQILTINSEMEIIENGVIVIQNKKINQGICFIFHFRTQVINDASLKGHSNQEKKVFRLFLEA